MPEQIVKRQIFQQRLLYIIAALVALGVGMAIWIMVNLIFTEAQQLQQLKKISDNQQQTIQQIKSGVKDLEASNNQQTAYIRCIAEFFAQPDRTSMTLADLDSCSIQANALPTAPVSTVSGTSQPTQSTTSQTAPTQTTTQSSNNNNPPKQGFFANLLKRLGL